jgi:ubiquinone/menaquinone biosynthesis C-methylase UbiE/uncharacterized protein YbaR (Trm112 family)
LKFPPPDEIRCPICKGDVLFLGDSYECGKCKAVFPLFENIPILIPKHKERFKENEDRIWQMRKDSLALREPSWKVLVQKADMIKCFNDVILRTNDFQGNILELGAGSCWASALVKTRFPRTTIYATDISPIALTKGIQVCKLMEVEVDYFVAIDAEYIPFRDELFDYVFSIALLHHLPSPDKALREIRRVLKPSGVYIGFGEIMSSRLMKPFYRRFSGAKERSDTWGILENVYTNNQWKEYLRRSDFSFYNVNLYKTPKYRKNTLGILYYSTLGKLPEFLLRNVFFSTCWIYAKC